MLKTYVNELISDISPGTLFPKAPIIPFYPEVLSCTDCNTQLHVQKTRIKRVVTMDIGAFRAKETILECPEDQAVFTSDQLRQLVPEQCTFGFDVIINVGMLLFVKSRNNQEIMKELSAKNVFISEREISYLGRKFIIYLALAHKESNDQLRRLLAKRGGYILHVDGTCEGDSPHLFCGLDGISELVLGAVKVPSENKDQLIPFFRNIKEQYGNPIALVHDMGTGIQAAVDDVFQGLLDFICHFHFLRDIGKDLLADDYQILMKRLRSHNVRSLLRQKGKYFEKKIDEKCETITHFKECLECGKLKADYIEHMPVAASYLLINWAFDSPSQSRGYGFPFDRPHLDFYRRLKEIRTFLAGFKDIHQQDKNNRSLIQVWHLLEEIFEDKELTQAVDNLEIKAEVFDKLRKALRIALPEGKNGLNDGGDEADIKSIEKNVTEFMEWLKDDEGREKTYVKMIEQIEKYWEKLFADPIVVDTPEGQVVIVPQRTNNILEHFFRNEKQLERKKSGAVSLNKTLKTILADTPLVRNLGKEEYLKIILNGCSTLEERFSQIDTKMVLEKLQQAKSNQEKISPEVKKIIKQPNLIGKISALFGVGKG